MEATEQTDASASAPKKKAPTVPREIRYKGRKSREVLLTEEKDEWVCRQMSARWSRNQVIDHCIGIAMHKVETAADNENAVAVTIDKLNNRIHDLSALVESLAGTVEGLVETIDLMARQVRMVAATANVEAVIRYATSSTPVPNNLHEYKDMVRDAMSGRRDDR